MFVDYTQQSAFPSPFGFEDFTKNRTRSPALYGLLKDEFEKNIIEPNIAQPIRNLLGLPSDFALTNPPYSMIKEATKKLFRNDPNAASADAIGGTDTSGYTDQPITDPVSRIPSPGFTSSTSPAMGSSSTPTVGHGGAAVAGAGVAKGVAGDAAGGAAEGAAADSLGSAVLGYLGPVVLALRLLKARNATSQARAPLQGTTPLEQSEARRKAAKYAIKRAGLGMAANYAMDSINADSELAKAQAIERPNFSFDTLFA
jgi:hypothetical protein